MRKYTRYLLVVFAGVLIIAMTALLSGIYVKRMDRDAAAWQAEKKTDTGNPEDETGDTETRNAETEAGDAEAGNAEADTGSTEAENAETDTGNTEAENEESENTETDTGISGKDAEETPSAEPTEEIVLRDPDRIIDTSTTLYSYEMMQEDLHYLAKVYPDIVRLYSAGTTEDGRDLSYVIFGDPAAPRQIYICAGTHAREYMTPQLVMRQLAYYCTEYDTGSYQGIPYRELFRNTCFYVEPMVNPDGISISQFGEAALRREDLRQNLRAIFQSDLSAGFAETPDYAAYLVRWKANALGVDINRNYSPGWETVTERSVPSSTFYKGPAPGSERETQAQMAIIESMPNPLMALSYHSYGDLVYWQYGQPEPLWSENQALAQHISNMTGQYLAGYSNEAGFSNWCILEKHLKSVTVETGTVPAPLPLSQFAELWEEHRLIWAMLAAVY